MNKILIGIGVIVIALAGWFLFREETISYVADVQEGVTALETELAELEAAVQTGTLTPVEAGEAQARIVSRINAITTASTAGQNAKLTDTQRAQLVEGLERLKRVLVSYQSTLGAIDAAVLELPESERPSLTRRNGSSGTTIAAIVAETIVETEEFINEIIETVIDEELAEELIDSLSEEYVAEEEMESSEETVGNENMGTNMAESTEETQDTPTGDTMSSEEEMTP